MGLTQCLNLIPKEFGPQLLGNAVMILRGSVGNCQLLERRANSFLVAPEKCRQSFFWVSPTVGCFHGDGSLTLTAICDLAFGVVRGLGLPKNYGMLVVRLITRPARLIQTRGLTGIFTRIYRGPAREVGCVDKAGSGGECPV